MNGCSIDVRECKTDPSLIEWNVYDTAAQGAVPPIGSGTANGPMSAFLEALAFVRSLPPVG